MAITPEDSGALSPVERALVDHVEHGVLLDLAGDQPIDEPAMRSRGISRTVRAWVIRDILRGRLAPDADPHGLRLRGARITGRVDLDNINSGVWLQLNDCLIEEGLTAADASLAGLNLAGSRLEHPSLSALNARRLTVTVLNLAQTTTTASTRYGAATLTGAHLGILYCDGAKLRNDSGPALRADRLHVEQGVYLRDGFDAVGAGEFGAVRLLCAHLGGLNLNRSRLRNDTGPALHADRLQVDQRVFMQEGVEAVGAGELGAVHLLGARLGGLECDGAKLLNNSGPALRADRLCVDQDVHLRDGFEAVGIGELGAIHLLGAHLGGLNCTSATLRNESGPALRAERLQVDQKLVLEEVEIVGAGEQTVLDLVDVRVGGALVFRLGRLEHHTNPHARIDVNGLVYAGLPQGIRVDEWLHLLREGTLDYAAQPYQHLAAAHRAAGHDSHARRILMAQRRDQIDRHALTGRVERAWARLTGLVLGYGYQPWRALIGLLVVIACAIVLAVILGGHGGLTQIRTPPPPAPQPCTVVERIGLGLDAGTPLLSTGTRAHCDTTNTATGQALTITGWVLRLLAWAFATLFVAGFTGAVRKT